MSRLQAERSGVRMLAVARVISLIHNATPDPGPTQFYIQGGTEFHLPELRWLSQADHLPLSSADIRNE